MFCLSPALLESLLFIAPLTCRPTPGTHGEIHPGALLQTGAVYGHRAAQVTGKTGSRRPELSGPLSLAIMRLLRESSEGIYAPPRKPRPANRLLMYFFPRRTASTAASNSLAPSTLTTYPLVPASRASRTIWG